MPPADKRWRVFGTARLFAMMLCLSCVSASKPTSQFPLTKVKFKKCMGSDSPLMDCVWAEALDTSLPKPKKNLR